MTYLLLFVVLIILGTFNAFVVSNMWAWFITPVFNIPVPQMHYVYGIMLTIAFLLNFETQSTDSTASRVLTYFIRGFIFLVIGWVVHLIFG